MTNKSENISEFNSSADPAIDPIYLVACTLVSVADGPDKVDSDTISIYRSLVEPLTPKASDSNQFIDYIEKKGLEVQALSV